MHFAVQFGAIGQFIFFFYFTAEINIQWREGRQDGEDLMGVTR